MTRIQTPVDLPLTTPTANPASDSGRFGLTPQGRGIVRLSDGSLINASLVVRGEWDHLLQYYIGDLVGRNGAGYVAKVDNSNVDPLTDPVFTWTQISGPGANGLDGINGRCYTYLVAASNASSLVRAIADYVCDGTADQVEINAALASLPAVGGTVMLSEGTFTIAAPIVTSVFRSTLQGMGRGATTIIVVNSGGAPINAALINLLHNRCTVKDLLIDGNKANNAATTTMYLVYSNVSLTTIENVSANNSGGIGIFTDSSSTYARVRNCVVETCASTLGGVLLRGASGGEPVASDVHSRGNSSHGFYSDGNGVKYERCEAVSNTGSGFYANGTDHEYGDCTAISNTIHGFAIANHRPSLRGCTARSNTGAGVISAGGVNDVAIQGGFFYLNGQSGIDLNGDGCQVSGATIKQNAQHGIRWVLNEGQITGCRISDNSTSSNLGFQGIVVAGNNNQVSLNQVRRGAGAARHQYGIAINGGSTANMCVYNDCLTGGVTGNFLDSGTSSVMTGTR